MGLPGSPGFQGQLGPPGAIGPRGTGLKIVIAGTELHSSKEEILVPY